MTPVQTDALAIDAWAFKVSASGQLAVVALFLLVLVLLVMRRRAWRALGIRLAPLRSGYR